MICDILKFYEHFNQLSSCIKSLELAFWNNRLRNFTQIYKQLRNERIRSMALILEATDSAYFPCFSTMFKNVVTGNQVEQSIYILCM